jgi:hypothetical protein
MAASGTSPWTPPGWSYVVVTAASVQDRDVAVRAIASRTWAASFGGLGRVKAVIDVSGAEDLAEPRLAASLPRRWQHVRSVGRRARWVAKTLDLPDELVAAAWLHDIGYAPQLVDTTPQSWPPRR